MTIVGDLVGDSDRRSEADGDSYPQTMVKISVGLLLAVVSAAVTYGRLMRKSERKVVNGELAHIGQFPFMIGIYYFDAFICGGTILTEKLVLTSGHCVCEDFTTPDSILISAGTSEHTDSDTMTHYVESIKCHQLLDIEEHLHDVAMVKIKDAFRISDVVKTTALITPDSILSIGKECTVIGWGYQMHNEQNFKPSFRKAHVPLVNLECCKLAYSQINVTVTDDMLCAGHVTGKYDACKGDSGGPLLCENIQVGIVSFGNKCGDPDYPGVFTDLRKYSPWLTDTAKAMCN